MRPSMILHFCATRAGLGGSARYVELITGSDLARQFQFGRIDAPWSVGGFRPAAVWRCVRILRQSRPCLLHLQGLGIGAFHMAVAARITRQPTLLTVHSFTEDERFRSSWQRRVIASWADPFTLRTATAAHCVSRYGSEKSAFRENVRHDLGWIDNAVPACEAPGRDEAVRRKFGFAPGDVVALCVSRLTREKGIQDLIGAMHRMAVRGKAQPRLLLVGDGPELNAFRQSAEPLLSSGRIVMAGRRNDVFRLLGAADFFVLPSLHENQSLAILEAMMAGKAVVATRVGGTPELVIDGGTGVLCPASDSEALAEAMTLVAEDAALRERLGAEGRKRALSEFSLERFTRRMGAAYEETLRLAREAGTRSVVGTRAAAAETQDAPPERVSRQVAS